MSASTPDEGSVGSPGTAKKDESHRVAVDFLLAEYGHLSDQFRWNEEIGERRVNIVLTIMTAASAATGVILSQSLSIKLETRLNAAGGVALGLLVLGLATLARIVRRNVATDEYRRALDDVRRRLKSFDPEILGDYDPFPHPEGRAGDQAAKRTTAKRRRPLKRLFGLTLFVSAINSLILVAGLLMFLRLPALGALVMAASVIVISMIAQLQLSQKIEQRLRQEVGFKDEELLLS